MPMSDSSPLGDPRYLLPRSSPLATVGQAPPRFAQVLLEFLQQIMPTPRLRRRRSIGRLSTDTGQMLQQMVDVTSARLVLALGSADGRAAVWLAGGLKEASGGRGDRALIVFEREAETARQTRTALRGAGISRYVDIRCDDPVRLLDELDTPVDLVLLLDPFDGEASALLPCLTARLRPGGVLLVPRLQYRRQALAGWLAAVRAADGAYRSLTLPIDGGLEWSVKR